MNTKTLVIVTILVLSLIIFVNVYQTITDKQFVSKQTGVPTESVERIFFAFTNSNNGWMRTYEANGKTYIVYGVFSLDLFE